MPRIFHSNTTCPAPPPSVNPLPVLDNLTFQHLTTWIALAFTALTLAISLLAIFRHLLHYTCPTEQRHIVRILVTPVVFSVLALFGIVSYGASKYLLPLQAVYEDCALASLFLLFVTYVAPEEREREAFFERVGAPPKKGESASSGGGFAGFRKVWIFVFLNALAGTVLGIATMAAQAAGTYCETSNNIHFAHIWIRILNTAFLALAVIGLLRFYGRFKEDMTVHKPLLKLVSFKAIVFVSTIQTLIISFLTGSHGVVKGGDKVTYLDLTIGIPALLVCIESTLFSLFMFVAYGTQEYRSRESGAQPKKFLFAAADAMNPADLIRGIARAVAYLLGGKFKSGGAAYTNLGRTKHNGEGEPGIPLGVMNAPIGYRP